MYQAISAMSASPETHHSANLIGSRPHRAEYGSFAADDPGYRSNDENEGSIVTITRIAGATVRSGIAGTIPFENASLSISVIRTRSRRRRSAPECAVDGRPRFAKDNLGSGLTHFEMTARSRVPTSRK